jgi:hypothetical protein
MYLIRRGSVQMPLTNGLRGWPAGQIIWPASQLLCRFGMRLFGTRLHEKGKTMAVEKVSGGRSHWPAGHVARLGSHHLMSYRLGQVGGATPWPYKYPPTSES